MTRASELDDINRNYPIRRQREKNGEKKSLMDLWVNIRISNTCVIRVSGEERERMGQAMYWKK